MDERDAPVQILSGAMSWHYCVLSALGVWLETRLIREPEVGKHSFLNQLQ